MAGSIILLLTTGLPEQKEHLKISFKCCCEWERLLNQWKYCKYWLCTENASSPELCRLLLKAHCHPWWHLIQGNMCSICLYIFASGVSICVHLSMWMCVWILVKGAVESLALSCCCRGTAVALATTALCKCNYRADTVWHPNWGTLTVFMILVCLLLFASVCPQMSPRPVYLTLVLYWKHLAKFGVSGQKWLAFWKCIVNLLLILSPNLKFNLFVDLFSSN